MNKESLEDKLSEIKQIKNNPVTQESIEILRKALSGSNNLVIREAAKAAGVLNAEELVPDLVDAFFMLISKSAKGDKGCIAKLAIVKTLNDFNYDDRGDVFTRGIHYIQLEPAFNGQTDTAAALRGICAFACARTGHPEIYYLLTDLLADREPEARGAAVRALVYMNSPESELLLRMKVLTGDEQRDIAYEALAGLVQINPDKSVDFAARYLDSNDSETAEDAAFVIAEARSVKAFDMLRKRREDSIDHEFKIMLLSPMALTKTDEAYDYLVSVIDNEDNKSGLAAIKALTYISLSPEKQEKLSKTVRSANSPQLMKEYEKNFS